MLSKKEMGERIKQAREEKSKQIKEKYTQRDLANDLGISQGYLGDIENGRTYPNYTMLSKIAKICGVPLSFFEEIEGHWKSETVEGPVSEYVIEDDNEPQIVKFIKKEAGRLTPEQEKEAIDYLKVILLKIKMDQHNKENP